MLVPRNPRDDDPIWLALEAALRGSSDFAVVRGGIVVDDPAAAWTAGSAGAFVSALHAQPLRYVGARHGLPLAPHFAVASDVDDSGRGVLVELVTMRFRGDGDRPAERDLLHDLGVVGACLSMARPTWTVVQTPLPPPTGIDNLPEGLSVIGGAIVIDLRAL